MEIISDYRFITKTGWTFTQLDDEMARHPYRVLLARVYQTVCDDVEAQGIKDMKAESKRRGMRR